MMQWNHFSAPLRNFLPPMLLLCLHVFCIAACAPAIKATALPEHLQRSAALEQSGDYATAIEVLKVAQTIDPDDNDLREQIKKLTVKGDAEAQKHYEEGIALKQKNPQAATQALLKALRSKPDYPAAVEELKNLQLRAALAKGQPRIAVPKGTATESETYDTLDIAISLYEDGDYPAALEEFRKARIKDPRNREIINHIDLCYYQIGVEYYKKMDYLKALNAFSKMRTVSPQADAYIKKTRAGLKQVAEDNYRAGLKFFREQKLHEAIARWNTVLEIDPRHQKAKEYIQKSKKLIEALKQ